MNNYVFDQTLAGLFIEPSWEERLMFLVNDIKSSLKNVDSLCWWQYRMGRTNCAAIDLSDGGQRSYCLTIILTGRTLWPDFNPEKLDTELVTTAQIDLIDAVEQNALVLFLINHFKLTSPRLPDSKVVDSLFFYASPTNENCLKSSIIN